MDNKIDQMTWYSEQRSYSNTYTYWDWDDAEHFTCAHDKTLTDNEIELQLDRLAALSKCHHCKSSLLTENRDDIKEHQKGSQLENHKSRVLRVCPKCGWWTGCDSSSLVRVDGLKDEGNRQTTRSEGIVKRFALSDKDAPMEALRHHLASNPNGVLHTSHIRFEELVGDVFADHYDCEVDHVGGPGDAGVDLVMVNGDDPCLIQVKRREKSGHIEGVRLVRELVGTMILEKARRGIIVTSAQRFSLPAQRTAEREVLQELQIEIQLMARDEFLQILGLTQSRVRDMWNK